MRLEESECDRDRKQGEGGTQEGRNEREKEWRKPREDKSERRDEIKPGLRSEWKRQKQNKVKVKQEDKLVLAIFLLQP